MDQALNVWRWSGGSPPQPWGRLARDPELWDNEGDTLVYYGQRYKQAAFRIHSSVLTKTKSEVFLNLLRESSRSTSDDDSSLDFPTNTSDPNAWFSPTPLSDTSSNPSSRQDSNSDVSSRKWGFKKGSTNPSLSINSQSVDEGAPIKYDICFPAPNRLSRPLAIQYHLTTRNIFALLLNKSPVGTDFGLTLCDLQKRLQAYLPAGVNCAKLMVRYIASKRLHDVRNSPSMAAGLLNWTEQPSVRWAAGWREAFVHCCGMFPRLKEHPEYTNFSDETQNLLEIAHYEMQTRVRAAEKKLLTFKFEDMWDDSDKKKTHPHVHAGFESCRRFLRHHYEKAYKFWRVRVAEENCNDSWLTRQLVKDLEADHGALYDYLVDREMIWGPDCSMKRTQAMPPTIGELDTEPLPSMLTKFDDKKECMAITHPYPLLPPSDPPESSESAENKPSKKTLFGNKPARARDKRIIQAYLDATNSAVLPKATQKNNLVEAFHKYEKDDQLRTIDPRDARKGRWMMIYGVLQVLAGISVDTPHLFFSEVPYFLSPRLKNTPPWSVADRQPAGGRTVVGMFDEASRLYSYCWTAPRRWGKPGMVPTPANANEVDATATQLGKFTIQGDDNMEDEQVETSGEAFLFNDDYNSGSGSPELDAEHTGMEKVGMPGFRAPTKPHPSRTNSGNVNGRSDYAAPNEW